MSMIVPRGTAMLRAVLLAFGASVFALSAQAQQMTDSHAFEITLRGLRAATLAFTGNEEAGRYTVQGNLASTGVLGLVRRVRYDASTTGRFRNGRYTPDSYSEKTDTGQRRSEAEMAYVRGVPQVKTYSPPRRPRDSDLDPSAQGGTVDPLTALYATLRDVDRADACNLALQVFDGRRRSRVTLSGPVADGDAVRCSGEYRRIAGFSDDEMRERTRFPFIVLLAPVDGDRLRVTEIEADTLFGRATLRRQ